MLVAGGAGTEGRRGRQEKRAGKKKEKNRIGIDRESKERTSEWKRKRWRVVGETKWIEEKEEVEGEVEGKA